MSLVAMDVTVQLAALHSDLWSQRLWQIVERAAWTLLMLLLLAKLVMDRRQMPPGGEKAPATTPLAPTLLECEREGTPKRHKEKTRWNSPTPDMARTFRGQGQLLQQRSTCLAHQAYLPPPLPAPPSDGHRRLTRSLSRPRKPQGLDLPRLEPQQPVAISPQTDQAKQHLDTTCLRVAGFARTSAPVMPQVPQALARHLVSASNETGPLAGSTGRGHPECAAAAEELRDLARASSPPTALPATAASAPAAAASAPAAAAAETLAPACAKGRGKGSASSAGASGETANATPSATPAPVDEPEPDATPAGAKGKGKGPAGPAPKGKGKGTPKAQPEPRKPIVQPRVQMKALRWRRLQLGVNLPEDTIWDEVPELEVDASLQERLCDLFAVRAASAACRPATPRAVVPEAFHIIDNMVLRVAKQTALAKLPAPEVVAQALENLDLSLLGSDVRDQLQIIRENACPTHEQRQQLENMLRATPDVSLGVIERYMLAVGQVPACKERLELWMYSISCDEDFDKLQEQMNKFEGMLSCFKSPAVSEALGMILGFGNFLNGGTRDGRADGFELDLLKEGGLNSVQDSVGGDLRRFVLKFILEEKRGLAGALLTSLKPALGNVKRWLVENRDGGLQLKKKVLISLECPCDELLDHLQTQLVERRATLRAVCDMCDSTAALAASATALAERLNSAGERLEALERRRSALHAENKKLQSWFHLKQETSEALFLLFDDLLMPGAVFEREPAQRVKNVLKPLFCGTAPIDVFALAQLWGASISTFKPLARSQSQGPLGRSESPRPPARARAPSVARAARARVPRLPVPERAEPETQTISPR